jgi:hypothetical protein
MLLKTHWWVVSAGFHFIYNSNTTVQHSNFLPTEVKE